MTEVDEIDAELRGPVNCWLNNVQQTKYARLLALARLGEVKTTQPVKVHDRPPAHADPEFYGRPPILPSF